MGAKFDNYLTQYHIVLFFPSCWKGLCRLFEELFLEEAICAKRYILIKKLLYSGTVLVQIFIDAFIYQHMRARAVSSQNLYKASALHNTRHGVPVLTFP